jgi:hypothetical protein
MSWQGFSKDEKIALAQLYVPYLALGMSHFRFQILPQRGRMLMIFFGQLWVWDWICSFGCKAGFEKIKKKRLVENEQLEARVVTTDCRD